MSQLLRFLRSSIGRKVLMAATGLGLILFLVAHLAGNLLLFAGPEAFNHYSHALISNKLIYLAEAILFIAFVAHFVSGFAVVRQNRAARPVGYVMKRRARHTSLKSLASTSMILSGLVLLVFVPLHVYTFKFGPWYDTSGEPVVRDLYRLVVDVFQNPLYVGWYVVAMIFVGFHLWHGFGSGIETLGVGSRAPIRLAGKILAVVLAGGFAIIPIVLFVVGGRS